MKYIFVIIVKISTKFLKLYDGGNMKARNLNNSSKKTRTLIKKVFAEMLSEYKQLDKISVTELVKRADINRGTFYSHYDDIYGVAEDFENELIEHFSDNAKLLSSTNFEEFLDIFFHYIKENNDNYKMLCKSNDVVFAIKKLADMATKKLTEICKSNPDIKNRNHIDLEITLFVDGLLFEYIRICREYSEFTVDDLYDYTKMWCAEFKRKRLGEQ